MTFCAEEAGKERGKRKSEGNERLGWSRQKHKIPHAMLAWKPTPARKLGCAPGAVTAQAAGAAMLLVD